jgi:hypothetical protein
VRLPPISWRPAILAAIAALVVYAVTLGGTYVYDDRYIILIDPRIANFSRWGEYWTKDYFLGGADNLYRPIVSMTYALQARLHGTSEHAAWAFHFVNWLLHAAVSASVAELTRRMTRSTVIATIAGLLFRRPPDPRRSRRQHHRPRRIDVRARRARRADPLLQTIDQPPRCSPSSAACSSRSSARNRACLAR